MRVVITGGAGFLGAKLARALLARGTLAGPDGTARPVERLVLVDLVRPQGLDDPRVEALTGDLADDALLRRALGGDAASVFHLAAVVSAQAEEDFDLGMRVNLDATRRLLDACRALPRPPRLVATSSVAVYGGALPDSVTDDTALRPQSSYGAQKAILELLVSDYARRGFVAGRVLRLPTVSVRPGKPSKAASSFASSIVREPLAGVEAVCPVTPATRVWILSPRRAVEGLVLGHELDAATLGGVHTVNLPGLSVSAAEMVAALAEVGGAAAAARVRWEPDPLVQRIVGSWPARWDVTRARALGFQGDPDFASVIRAYVAEELGGAAAR